jgi:hypothetical protein
MKKLQLHAEELRVESFPTIITDDDARGTVQAHATGGHTCVLETRCAARSCFSFDATCFVDEG